MQQELPASRIAELAAPISERLNRIYGPSDALVRGSGLFVPMEGLATNHHFLLPKDGTAFHLLAGDYTLRVYAKTVTSRKAQELAAIRVRISDAQAQELLDRNTGIYFDWGPDQQSYQSHTEQKAPKLTREPLLEHLGWSDATFR